MDREAAETRRYADIITGGNIFVPISVGSRIFPRSRVRRIVQFVQTAAPAKVLYLICDDLATFSSLALGAADRAGQSKKTRQLGAELVRFVRDLTEQGSPANANVLRWRDVSRTSAFRQLFDRVKESLDGDTRFDDFIRSQMRIVAKRLGSPDRIRAEWERFYLLNEVTMSLFVTELMGFNVEIYPGEDIAFLEEAYRRDKELVRSLVKKRRLRREFVNFRVVGTRHRSSL